MLEQNDEQPVSLETLAQLAGLPLELVNKELFDGKEMNDTVSLKDLREAMLTYIDATMLEK